MNNSNWNDWLGIFLENIDFLEAIRSHSVRNTLIFLIKKCINENPSHFWSTIYDQNPYNSSQS